ncbi:hypothetical protein GPECTOR_2g1117 [Gonium pectorale]|uniref:Citrate transporter-like domain-containing protein n=1 Tax=Gonium pectorale TaxID=33097 RepID=A0A150H127_GONPE|nr:hypothetical protein GPECTOR_2g1117 [Gonium pectorale]|eukprot:KXZ55568.1 hypothetical protein GPECTOR_2g1117 [Gonium pectorale]
MTVLDLLPLSTTALVCLFCYLFFGILTVQQFRNAIPGSILLTIAGAFGVARALTVTGLADRLASSLLRCFSWMGGSGAAGIGFKGPLYALMVGASSDFSTPIGYQTNLMVSGPGGYRFLDYTRFGLPLQIIVAFITIPICVKYFA